MYLDSMLKAVKLQRFSIVTSSQASTGYIPPSTNWQFGSRPGRLLANKVSQTSRQVPGLSRTRVSDAWGDCAPFKLMTSLILMAQSDQVVEG